MKENTETISENIFIHFPSSDTRSYTRSLSCRNKTSLFIDIIKKRVLACRDQLQNAVASLGIGAAFLITVYLFLSQLAEYGWQ